MLLSIYLPVALNAQILSDTASQNLVRKSIGYIYNLKFSEYSQSFEKLKNIYPRHPVIYLLEGMKIYWEHYPLINPTPDSYTFEKKMKDCIDLCESDGSKSDDPELLLANLSARGFLLLFYLDNNMTMSVIPLATSTYRYIRRSYDFTSVYPDFLFFTGLYDYTRVVYPETYPVYKPVAMLFPKGNKQEGLKELKKAAESSIFLRAESALFLSGLNLTFEKNFSEALEYSRYLHELYPENAEFLGFHIRNLLLTKRYDEAEALLNLSPGFTNNPFYQAQATIFTGILKEKKYHDDKDAERLYIKGISDLTPFSCYGNEFAAYAYFGLSRISGRKSDPGLRKSYRRQAEELADAKDINFD